MAADCLAAADAGGALRLTREIGAAYPRDYQTALLAAEAQLRSGQREAARSLFRQAVAADPENRLAHEGLVRCGAEEAASVLADLPPLKAADGERPSISAAALGHLYLRQYLLSHSVAQLSPLWQAHPDRLDLGVALAEAAWRLGEDEEAAQVCQAVLVAAPDCLKANLILAQIHWAAGRQDEAARLAHAGEQVDPENRVAEDLYEWLRVGDENLVPPLRRQYPRVELGDEQPSADAQAAPAPAAVSAPEPPALEESNALEPAEPAADEEALDLGDQDVAVPPQEVPADARSESAPSAEPSDANLAEVDLEAVSEADGAQLEAPPFEFVAADPANVEEPQAPMPVDPVNPAVDLPEPEEPEPSEPVVSEAALPKLVERVARSRPRRERSTGASPAEGDALLAATFSLRAVEVDRRGQLGASTLKPGALAAAEQHAADWTVRCQEAGRRLSLGALAAASVESERGAVQLVHEADTITMAVAPPGTNLGLVRASLRRSTQPRSTPQPSWNEP